MDQQSLDSVGHSPGGLGYMFYEVRDNMFPAVEKSGAIGAWAYLAAPFQNARRHPLRRVKEQWTNNR